MSEPLPLVWIDIETTGLSIEDDELMEVAAFTTGPEGEDPSEVQTWLIAPRATVSVANPWWDRLVMNRVPLEMHVKSGLFLDYVYEKKVHKSTFLTHLATMISEVCDKYGTTKVTMAGSGVGPFDLPFLKRVFRGEDTLFEDTFTYYVMDVGVIGRFVRNVLGIELPERPVVSHRAKDDILDHYHEFLEYKKLLAKRRRTSG